MYELEEIKEFIVFIVIMFTFMNLVFSRWQTNILFNDLNRFYYYKFIKRGKPDYYKMADDLKENTEVILKNQGCVNLSTGNFHFEVIKGWFTTYFEYYDNKYVKGCNKKWFKRRGYKIYKKRRDVFTREKLLLYLKTEYLEELNKELQNGDYNFNFKRVYFMSKRIKNGLVSHTPRTKENEGLDHTLIVGGIGTGKTSLAKKLMGKQRDERVIDLRTIIYDKITDLSNYNVLLIEQTYIHELDYVKNGMSRLIDLIKTSKYKGCKVITEYQRLDSLRAVDREFFNTVNTIYKLG